MIDISLKNETQNPAYRPAFLISIELRAPSNENMLASHNSILVSQKKEILLTQDLFFHLY